MNGLQRYTLDHMIIFSIQTAVISIKCCCYGIFLFTIEHLYEDRLLFRGQAHHILCLGHIVGVVDDSSGANSTAEAGDGAADEDDDISL